MKSSQSQVLRLNMQYVVIGGDRVVLEPLGSVAVLHGPGNEVSRLRDLCARIGIEVVATDEDAGVLVVESNVALIEQALRAAKLTRRVRVESAYRQVGGPPDDLWAPTGRLAVRFPNNWDWAQVDIVFTRRGLHMLEPIDGMPGGYIVMTPKDSIESARALVEEDGAIFAEPDFIQRMHRRMPSPRMGSRPTPAIARGPLSRKAIPTARTPGASPRTRAGRSR